MGSRGMGDGIGYSRPEEVTARGMGEKCRAEDLHSASVADKQTVKEHAQ